MEEEEKKNNLIDPTGILTEVSKFSQTMVIVLDKSGTIQQFNDVAESELGYLAEEVVGKHTPLLFHAEDEIYLRQKELLHEDKPRQDFIAIANEIQLDGNEWHYICKNGTTLFVRVHIRQLNDLTEAGDGYLLLANNISERKWSENELMAALKKERELNELKSRFVSMASHEFRTPLGGILSSTYLISKYKKEEHQPQREKHIEQIVASVKMLTEILDEFLSVGKIEEGKVQPQYVQFDAKTFTEKMIAEVSHLLKHSQKIIYNVESDECLVRLDPSMLKHIILNLLSNAIKFSTDEGLIEVYTECHESTFTLRVKDYGIGIPKNEQVNLFGLFFRSSYTHNIQGTGLGLHIVKKYVELMDGEIHLKSEIGEGTEFTIQFTEINN